MSIAACRAPLALPHDPTARYSILATAIGTRIRLSGGDFVVEGELIAVVRPAMHSEAPNPVVVIDVGGERIAGPVLHGDVLA